MESEVDADFCSFLSEVWVLGGEVAAFRRQNQVGQLEDTWPIGLLYL